MSSCCLEPSDQSCLQRLVFAARQLLHFQCFLRNNFGYLWMQGVRSTEASAARAAAELLAEEAQAATKAASKKAKKLR